MKQSFNLSKLQKKAFNEGGQASIKKMTRCMSNCYKTQLDNGKSGQDAFFTCQKEFQSANSNDWNFKYAKKNN